MDANAGEEGGGPADDLMEAFGNSDDDDKGDIGGGDDHDDADVGWGVGAGRRWIQ